MISRSAVEVQKNIKKLKNMRKTEEVKPW